jgi:ATP-binding cassette subfamily B protein
VILDEPFSELNHQQHREMLEHSRATWHDATLLYITHDLELSTTFKRVLVVHDGQVAEDGVPQDLLNEPTLYARMHASAKSWQEAKQQMGNPRYIRLQDGVLKEGVP